MKSHVINTLEAPDDGAFVHMFNENTSWHGHTVLAIEFSDHCFWGLSFQPKNEGEPFLNLLTGVDAQIVDRTFLQAKEPGLIGDISSKVLSYALTKAQVEKLIGIINREKIDVNRRAVTYATTGLPMSGLTMSGYRDTCYSWAVRVLVEAGIEYRVWTAVRWFSMAPVMTDVWGKNKTGELPTNQTKPSVSKF